MSAARSFGLLVAATLAAQVPYERIVNADREPGSWLTYSRNYLGQRFSPLDQITPANVARLKVKWAYQFDVPNNEVSPIVADGVMYVTGPNTRGGAGSENGPPAVALAPADSVRLPEHRIRTRESRAGDSGRSAFRRDAGLLPGRARHQERAGALVHASGRLQAGLQHDAGAARDTAARWWSGSAAEKRAFAASWMPTTRRPASARGASGRFPGRASPATIPGRPMPGRPAADRPGSPAHTIRTRTCCTGASGNPGPDWNGDPRPGDNLYTCSLVALDGDTGKLRWHFQFTPHDTHDWDAAHVPVLFDAVIRGQKRKVVANANRNAFYYVLDRENGQVYGGAGVCEADLGQGSGR